MGTKQQTKLTEKQKRKAMMPLIGRAAELDANIKEMAAELAEIKDEIKAYEPAYGDYAAPGAELKIKPYHSLNKARAEQAYGDNVKELVVTPNAVRAYLGEKPDKIAALYDETYTLTFRYVGEQ